jgi:hypothetical protein
MHASQAGQNVGPISAHAKWPTYRTARNPDRQRHYDVQSLSTQSSGQFGSLHVTLNKAIIKIEEAGSFVLASKASLTAPPSELPSGHRGSIRLNLSCALAYLNHVSEWIGLVLIVSGAQDLDPPCSASTNSTLHSNPRDAFQSIPNKRFMNRAQIESQLCRVAESY